MTIRIESPSRLALGLAVVILAFLFVGCCSDGATRSGPGKLLDLSTPWFDFDIGSDRVRAPRSSALPTVSAPLIADAPG